MMDLNTPLATVFAGLYARPHFGGRIKRVLEIEGVRSLRDLVQKTEVELLRTPNFGRRSLSLIGSELEKLGLRLNTVLDDQPPPNWRPMFQAPKDGRRFIALRSDFSDVAMIHANHFGAWVAEDLTVEYAPFAGWMPLPPDTPKFNGGPR